VDVAVDPNEPPMPGKVSYEQAKKFAGSFLHGQPHRGGDRHGRCSRTRSSSCGAGHDNGHAARAGDPCRRAREE
jgi:hypothetical protein